MSHLHLENTSDEENRYKSSMCVNVILYPTKK